MRSTGVDSRDYVGMSSENTCEKQVHRKSKVSWGRLIHPGLVDPKLRPIGVSDGCAVNIRQPARQRYHLSYDVGGLGLRSVGCLRSCPCKGTRGPQSKERGKCSKSACQEKYDRELLSCSYQNPTQVDFLNMVRCSR